MRGSGALETGAVSREPALIAGSRGTSPGNASLPGAAVPGGKDAKGRARGMTRGAEEFLMAKAWGPERETLLASQKRAPE